MPAQTGPNITGWLLDHPIAIPIILTAALVGAMYGWNKLRAHQNARGKILPPLGTALKNVLKLALKEDKRPLLNRPKILAQKTAWLTGPRLYPILAATLAIGPRLGLTPRAWLAIATLATLLITTKTKPVLAARRSTLMQMYAVAAAECRYPRGAELNPWTYIAIQNWVNLTQPGQTAVTYPAAYQSEDQRTREKFERQFNGTVSEENTWTYEWESPKNRVICKPTSFLPDKAPYPGPGKKWNEIPVGVTGTGEAVWNVQNAPHSLVCGPTGSGKAFKLSTTVPTPTGWTTVGEIRVGDKVFDQHGRVCNVVGLSPIDEHPDAYDVVFSDGAVVTADAEHLWWTETRGARQSRWDQKRRHGKHEPLLSVAARERLAVAAAAAGEGDEITIAEAAGIAGAPPTTPWLRQLGEEVGQVGEINPEVVFHYKAQTVVSMQKVRRWPAREVWAALTVRETRAGWLWESFRPVFKELAETCDPAGRVSAREALEALGIEFSKRDRMRVVNLLESTKVPHSMAKEPVEQVVPAKTVRRKGTTARTYPRRALLERMVEWGARTPYDQRFKTTSYGVRTTKEILETLRTKWGHANHSVPVAEPLQLPDADLPIPPYTLGVWLGDGSSRTGQVAGIDHEVARNMEADGYVVSERTAPTASADPNFRLWRPIGLTTQLNKAGLLKKDKSEGRTKFIPGVYLRASVAQRRALLAGLLDTDGTVSPQGGVEITQVCERLAGDIHELAVSLGFRATCREGRAVLDGVEYGPAWTVSWTCGVSPFWLSRKTEAFRERSTFSEERNGSRYIVDVRPAVPVPMRCLMVDSPDRVFLVGENMIPTHNSVLQRNILFHVLAHSDEWKVVAIDPKRVELGWLKEYPSVLKVALTLEDGVEVVRSVRDEMMRRFDEMEAMGCNYFQDLPDPPPALLCMVDETYNFLAPEGIRTEEGKERDRLHGEGSVLLGEIARLGRAAGVHLVLATQRPDAAVLKGEMKNNLDCRIAAGRMDTTPSLMVLDSEHAARLPKKVGRGIIRLGGEVEVFQGYFAEKDWFDQWLAAQGAAGPGVPAGPQDAGSQDDVGSGVGPDGVVGDGPRGAGRDGGGKKRRGFGLGGGLKAVAARAAAAAEARSQSLDSPAPVSSVDVVESPAGEPRREPSPGVPSREGTGTIGADTGGADAPAAGVAHPLDPPVTQPVQAPGPGRAPSGPPTFEFVRVPGKRDGARPVGAPAQPPAQPSPQAVPPPAVDAPAPDPGGATSVGLPVQPGVPRPLPPRDSPDGAAVAEETAVNGDGDAPTGLPTRPPTLPTRRP